jgi:hypothetical protein
MSNEPFQSPVRSTAMIASCADAEWPLEVVAHVLLVAAGPGDDDDDDDDTGGGGGGGYIDPDYHEGYADVDDVDEDDEDPLWAGARRTGNSVSLQRSKMCYHSPRAVTCE